jgi:hypothetical protein
MTDLRHFSALRWKMSCLAADFEGGARRMVPPPPSTHEEWLADALADGRADVGADL